MKPLREPARTAPTLSFFCISPPRTASPQYEHAPSCTQRRAFCAMASFIAAAMYLTLPGLTPAMENLPFVVGQRRNISRCHPARATSSEDFTTESKDLPFLVQ